MAKKKKFNIRDYDYIFEIFGRMILSLLFIIYFIKADMTMMQKAVYYLCLFFMGVWSIKPIWEND